LILPKLFDWCLEKEVSIHLTTLVYPEKYMYTNLPDKVLTNGITNLSMYIDKFKEKHTQDQLRGLVVNAKSELTNWVDFCSEVSMRDNHRKNSIFDVLPELKEYWTDAKTN
jgi:hypothetical protein